MFTVALVGRPNVGKSSLFNLLVRCRDAIVSDQPGLTRDRRYGLVNHLDRCCLLIDTAGLFSAKGELNHLAQKQTNYAIEEADLLLLVVSARDGITTTDETIMRQLRRSGKPTHLIVNKIDGLERQNAELQFASLGLRPCFVTSASHNVGMRELAKAISRPLAEDDGQRREQSDKLPRIALLGRPNSGKSTLFNRLLGQERAISSPVPGTTRDSIVMPCDHGDESFTLIDTAGLRRRRKVSSAPEKISAIKSLALALNADVIILLYAADQGLSSQDLALAGKVLDAGRSLVLAANKRDLLDRKSLQDMSDQIKRALPFTGVELCCLSALRGKGIDRLIASAMRAYRAAGKRVSANECNRLLRMALQRHHPDGARGKRPKLRYMHQGGIRPPLFIVHGSRLDKLSPAYRRYLENFLRRELDLPGTAIAFRFRNKDNPYVA